MCGCSLACRGNGYTAHVSVAQSRVGSSESNFTPEDIKGLRKIFRALDEVLRRELGAHLLAKKGYRIPSW